MSEAVFGALVVGCGAVGSGYDEARDGLPLSHAGAYAAHARTALVGGVDPESEARRRFEDRWQVPAYATVAEALTDVRPGLVSLASPPVARADVVRTALDADVRAIWAEKPLAPGAAEAAAIVDMCAAAGIPLQVNFIRRFDPLHRRLAESLERPFHADFRFSGTLANYGPHAFDLFRWYAGEIAGAAAVQTAVGEPVVFLDAEEGSTATVFRVRSGDADMFECDFYTERGKVTLAGLGRTLVRTEHVPSDLFADVTVLGDPVADPSRGLDRAMLAAVDSLIRCLDDGSPVLCTGRDAVAALLVEEAVREAAQAGVRVEVAAA